MRMQEACSTGLASAFVMSRRYTAAFVPVWPDIPCHRQDAAALEVIFFILPVVHAGSGQTNGHTHFPTKIPRIDRNLWRVPEKTTSAETLTGDVRETQTCQRPRASRVERRMTISGRRCYLELTDFNCENYSVISFVLATITVLSYI